MIVFLTTTLFTMSLSYCILVQHHVYQTLAKSIKWFNVADHNYLTPLWILFNIFDYKHGAKNHLQLCDNLWIWGPPLPVQKVNSQYFYKFDLWKLVNTHQTIIKNLLTIIYYYCALSISSSNILFFFIINHRTTSLRTHFSTLD